MKKKLIKKYFNIQDLEDVKVSNLENYIFNDDAFKNKRASLVKKLDISKDDLDLVYFDLANKYNINIGELLSLYKGYPNWEKALMFLIEENNLNAISNKSNIVSNSLYEKELDIMLQNQNQKFKEEFNQAFIISKEFEEKIFLNYNQLIKFFSRDETLLLMLLDSYLIEEGDDYIVVKFGNYKVSNKKLSFEKEKCTKSDVFPYIYKSIFLKEDFNENNIILPNGKRYSKENFNQLIKKD